MFQRPLGPLSLANAFPDVARQGTVVQHVKVGVEELALLGTQVLCHLRVNPLDVVASLTDGPVEKRKFGADVFRLVVGDQL